MKQTSLFLILIITLTSCSKDEEPEFTTVKKLYPVEGRYTGTFYMDNDTINLHWKYDNQLSICAINGEELLMENMNTTAKAWMGTGEYSYEPFWKHGKTPCGQVMVAQFFGTGTLTEDGIKESGWFKMTLSGKPIRGTWKSVMTKDK